MEKLILVNQENNVIGFEEKMKAHVAGKLHRAFSIFVFNSEKQLMLQKRALQKYHSGGLWSNTCCGHPRPGEEIDKAAHRRLKEEMGFDCSLVEIFSFKYKIKFENGLWENEYVHVLVGKHEQAPLINPEEAMDWKWVEIKKVKREIKENPTKYTYWLGKELSHPNFKVL